MSDRELIVLGTSSQVPTAERNHNGYLLRWGTERILFDPGEGTQRQLLRAGESPAQITRICVTHLHGDHCFGLPGVLQRMAMDHVVHDVTLHYPASGQREIDLLLALTCGLEGLALRLHPSEEGALIEPPPFRLLARRLEHRVDALGYRIEEPDSRRMLPDRLEAAGIGGVDVSRLIDAGSIDVGGRVVRLEDMSEPRPGQRFAFVMDTRRCDAADALAEGADMLVCEATFLAEHADLARRYGHMTAGEAAAVARDAGVRRLVLTHFSQRYPDLARRAAEEAGAIFDDVVVADDLQRIPLPPRR